MQARSSPKPGQQLIAISAPTAAATAAEPGRALLPRVAEPAFQHTDSDAVAAQPDPAGSPPPCTSQDSNMAGAQPVSPFDDGRTANDALFLEADADVACTGAGDTPVLCACLPARQPPLPLQHPAGDAVLKWCPRGACVSCTSTQPTMSIYSEATLRRVAPSIPTCYSFH